MLTQNAGQADFRFPKADGLAAAVAFPGSPTNIIDTPDDIRIRVRSLVAAGADCIKLATSGGVTSPHDQPDWLGLRPELARVSSNDQSAGIVLAAGLGSA
ncbi:hypothetical protein [Streptomyces sp. NPDC059171]